MTVQIWENIVRRVFALNKLALKALNAQEQLFAKAICVKLVTSQTINAKPTTLAKLTRHVGLMSVPQTKIVR